MVRQASVFLRFLQVAKSADFLNFLAQAALAIMSLVIQVAHVHRQRGHLRSSDLAHQALLPLLIYETRLSSRYTLLHLVQPP